MSATYCTDCDRCYGHSTEWGVCEQCNCASEITECGGCLGRWCDRCDPAHGPLCPWCHGRGYSTAAIRRPLYRQANHVHPDEYDSQED